MDSLADSKECLGHIYFPANFSYIYSEVPFTTSIEGVACLSLCMETWGMSLGHSSISGELPNNAACAADVLICTSKGSKIPAHSTVLASESKVFEEIIERRRRKGKMEKDIAVLGVPSPAVAAFLLLLHSRRSCEEVEQTEMMDKYGMHLMVLSHAYQVHWLKKICEVELALRLTVDSVVDLLLLSRQCDMPKLYLQCMKLLQKDFPTVEKTEAWGFLQENDPCFELEILQFLEAQDLKEKRRKKKMEEQKTYQQLSEAMECVQRIFSEGCAHIGPCNKCKPWRKMESCPNYTTCQAIQLLLQHLAFCTSKRSTCYRCRRVWDLLRLHSYVCNMDDHQCRVPLCMEFKRREQVGRNVDREKWKVLAKKVASVYVVSFIAKRRKHKTGCDEGTLS